MYTAHLVADIQAAALSLRRSHPELSARVVLDAVMAVSSGLDLRQRDPGAADALLSPRGPFAELLRAALAPEIEAIDMGLADDADEAVKAVFLELWRLSVVDRFSRRYFAQASSPAASPTPYCAVAYGPSPE